MMRFLTAASFDDPVDDRIYNRVATRLLPFLMLLYIVSFLDKINVGFAKAGMSAELGLSNTAFGIGAGIFFIGYCICEIPSNLALQRFGARVWIARIMIVWGAISVAMMFVTTEREFFIARFVLGVAEAGFYPGVVFYLTFWFPARLRSQVCALFFLGISLSGVVGGPLSGGILTIFEGVHGLHGWRWLFLLEGLPAVLLGVVTLFWLDDGPAKAKWLPAADRERIAATLEQENTSRAGESQHRFADAFRNRNVWLMTAVNFALLGNTYGVSFWLPQIARGLGVRNPMANGLVTMLPFVVASIAMLVISRSSDRHGERRFHLIASSFASAAGLALAAVSAGMPVLSLTGLALALSGALGGLAVLWAIPGTLLSGTAAGAAIALMATVGNLSGYASPVLIGWISQRTGHVEDGLLALAAITCALSVCAWGLARVMVVASPDSEPALLSSRP
ncbi:MFS transporter [Burkholderia sp. S171]|uniref:MFS transporter n=1 Tax=Burkholderia sp. S171 TaxID=1641860 RepID=UPI0020B1278F|nr:MFS transporter [Burkholderia sp. S171]